MRDCEVDVELERLRAVGDSMAQARDALRVALLQAIGEQVSVYLLESMEEEGEPEEVLARTKVFMAARVARVARAAVLPPPLRAIELSCESQY